MSHTHRYFEMLGAAYEVPSEADRFNAFLDAAMAYFFGDEDGNGQLAEDVPRHSGDDAKLESHRERISALIEEASRREVAGADSFHAVLEVSARTGLVTGNDFVQRGRRLARRVLRQPPRRHGEGLSRLPSEV